MLVTFNMLTAAFMTALAGCKLLVTQKDLSELTARPLTLKMKPTDAMGVTVDLSMIRELLEEDRYAGITPLVRMVFSATLTQTYSCLLAYSKGTKQLEKLKRQPWFHFYRLLRNCLAHDLRFCFDPRTDSRLLPVEWNGIRITSDMEGKEFSFSWLGVLKAIDLLAAAERFVKDDLL